MLHGQNTIGGHVCLWHVPLPLRQNNASPSAATSLLSMYNRMTMTSLHKHDKGPFIKHYWGKDGNFSVFADETSAPSFKGEAESMHLSPRIGKVLAPPYIIF